MPGVLLRHRGSGPDPDRRLDDHVDRLGSDHPPIDLATVDYTVLRPEAFRSRFGAVLHYMARVELEVERNVLELAALLPHPPDVDRRFYADVWHPQEVRHGEILDHLQVVLGQPPAVARTEGVSAKVGVLGALAHLSAVQDVVRMLYHLTGMTTERSAMLAYTLLHDGSRELGEEAVARTVVAPIRRQEPGHYAFYQLSARGLWAGLAPWQRWLVRHLRRASFAPVGVGDAEQSADLGDMMAALDVRAEEVDGFVRVVARAEHELLWARDRGLAVPDYVARAFRDAIERSEARRAA